MGPPGIGKTRLALAVGERLTPHFAHGVVFVDLAPIRGAERVPYAIAQALNVTDVPRRPILARVKEVLEDTHLLLILDNFEHVLEAAPSVPDILAACSGVKVLATSREPLHLTWEREFPVPPLDVPDLSRPLHMDDLAACPSVALFVLRAQAVDPATTLTPQNAAVIGGLCVQLDGLPLAIEMAAAQVKALTPDAIARRYRAGLDVLVAPAHDLPDRHRTLRAAIGWSYNLLTPDEQLLFRRLAVFPGGCTAVAAATVCDGGPETDLVGRLTALVDKSLLRHEPMLDGSSRFRQLESLRQFGIERLVEIGEWDSIQRRHADFFLGLVEHAEPELRGHRQSEWLSVLDVELPNVTAALESYVALGDVESAMRLAGAVWWFWDMRGRWTEGQEWLERLIAAGHGAPEPLLARVVYAAGHLAFHRGDIDTMARYLLESEAMYRRLGDQRGLAETLWMLGHLFSSRGDLAAALARLEEGLLLFRRAGDPWGVAQILYQIAQLECEQGHYARATSLSEEGLAVSRQHGLDREAAHHLATLGLIARNTGEHGRAAILLQEALELHRKVGQVLLVASDLLDLGVALRDGGEYRRADQLFEEGLALHRKLSPEGAGAAVALMNLGISALRQRNRRQAVRLLHESLAISIKHQRRLGVANCLETLAEIDARRNPKRAVVLLGAAEALREHTGIPRPPADRASYDGTVARVRDRLDTAAFEAGWAAGLNTPMAEAGALALSGRSPLTAAADAEGPPGTRLSRREREVARLVSQGLSNRQIAAALFVAETTAESHVQSILNKLGFNNRAQIAAWIAAHRSKTS